MKMPTGRAILLSSLLLLAAGVLSTAVGSVAIPLERLFSLLRLRLTGAEVPAELVTIETIISNLRLPRTVLMGMAGAALAGSGAAYQGLFRNPLADPYLIGVASGAGLGAVIAMSLPWSYSLLGMYATPLLAFLSSLITVWLVYQLARVGRTVPTTNLILAGVAVGGFASAVTSFLMLNTHGEVRRALVWLLGGASLSGWQPVFSALPYILLGTGSLLLMGHPLNVLQFGDEQAQQLGLPTVTYRRWIILAASLATAAAISFAGVIGFVGLIVPHAVRLVLGGDYRRLLPLAVINGATLLVLADVLGRVLMPPQEIPVGILTSLAGAPFFLWLLRRAKQQYFW